MVTWTSRSYMDTALLGYVVGCRASAVVDVHTPAATLGWLWGNYEEYPLQHTSMVETIIDID